MFVLEKVNDVLNVIFFKLKMHLVTCFQKVYENKICLKIWKVIEIRLV